MTQDPKCLSADVQDSIVFGLWRDTFPSKSSDVLSEHLMTLLSPRNVEMLAAGSRSPRDSWEKLEHLLNRLLKSGMLIPLALEDQCLELTRHEWPQVKGLVKPIGMKSI